MALHMASPRYFNIGTAKDYAKAHGISERTARRRLASNPDAVKTGKGWKVPLPSTVFAKVRGISPKKARSEGTRTTDPGELTRARTTKQPSGLVPWDTVPRRAMRNPAARPYQYQGAATVRFKTSGEITTIFTPNIDSAKPLTYARLDAEIRQWVDHRFGSSPVEVIRTWPVRAVSHLPFTPLRLVS